MEAKRNGGRGLLSSILGLALLLVTGWSPRSAPLLQTPTATLRLINDSEQTICAVFISSSAADGWGPDRLGGNDTVLPGETATFDLTPGNYDVLLLDCNQNAFLQEYDLPISGQYDPRFTGRPIEATLMDETFVLYQQADFWDALEKFQQALLLYQQAGDRWHK